MIEGEKQKLIGYKACFSFALNTLNHKDLLSFGIPPNALCLTVRETAMYCRLCFLTKKAVGLTDIKTTSDHWTITATKTGSLVRPRKERKMKVHVLN